MEDQVFDAEYFSESAESTMPATVQPAMPAQQNGHMVQTRTPFHAAIQVQKPRDLAAFQRHVLAGAEALGREAFFAWGSGKQHVEGATIHLANLMLTQYGNAIVHADPIQETAEGWYYTHHFVDLETMTSKTRQFFQSKREDVGMRVDPIRANQIRFNKGQSKAIRNCIIHAMPRALVLQALQAAKKGVSAKMDRFIKEKGLAAAQQYTVGQLKTVGVDEAAILQRTGQERIADLGLDDLVMLAADYKAIDNGDVNASELFELKEAKPAAGMDLKSKLKAQAMAAERPIAGHAVEQAPKAERSIAEHASQITVKPGKQPFTYYVNDGMGEYLTAVDGDKMSCNCGS
jgi:hypothetical protein